MAGITVHPVQRRGAQKLLDEAIEVASGSPDDPRRDGYREWLTQPSEGRRKVLGQAGFNEAQWAARIAPVVASWWGWPRS